MARAPFQILVFPFIQDDDGGVKYAIFKRNDMDNAWQALAGGGEDGETPEQAAIREAFEESGLRIDGNLMALESMARIPVVHISGFLWGSDVLTVPEYSFAVEAHSTELAISDEHSDYQWLDYQQAYDKLTWDSNKNALWELNHRLTEMDR